MKIISRGNQRLTCETCASVLEYEYPDIQFDLMGPYIICPVCKKQIDVDRTIKPKERVNDYDSITITSDKSPWTTTINNPSSSGYDLFMRDGVYCSAAINKVAANAAEVADSITTLSTAISSIKNN